MILFKLFLDKPFEQFPKTTNRANRTFVLGNTTCWGWNRDTWRNVSLNQMQLRRRSRSCNVKIKDAIGILKIKLIWNRGCEGRRNLQYSLAGSYREGKSLFGRQGKAPEREGKCAWERQQLTMKHPPTPHLQNRTGMKIVWATTGLPEGPR